MVIWTWLTSLHIECSAKPVSQPTKLEFLSCYFFCDIVFSSYDKQRLCHAHCDLIHRPTTYLLPTVVLLYYSGNSRRSRPTKN